MAYYILLNNYQHVITNRGQQPLICVLQGINYNGYSNTKSPEKALSAVIFTKDYHLTYEKTPFQLHHPTYFYFSCIVCSGIELLCTAWKDCQGSTINAVKRLI